MSFATEENSSLVLHSAGVSAGERFAQACGIVLVVCVFAAGFFSPDPPSHGAPDAAVLAFYQQHAGGVLTGAFLWALAMMALVVFAVALSRACEAAHRFAASGRIERHPAGPLPTVLLGPLSAVSAAVFVISQGVGAAGAMLAMHGAPAASVRALDEVWHMTGHLWAVPLGSLVLVAGLAQKVTARGARWIAWLGIAAGGVMILATTWVFVGQQWLHSVGVFALLAFLIWSVASSVSLLRSKSAALRGAV